MFKEFVEAWTTLLAVSWFDPTRVTWYVALALAGAAAALQLTIYGWIMWNRWRSLRSPVASDRR